MLGKYEDVGPDPQEPGKDHESGAVGICNPILRAGKVTRTSRSQELAELVDSVFRERP